MVYLDYFLFVGRADSDECARLLDAFQTLSDNFEVPLAEEKKRRVLHWIDQLVDWARHTGKYILTPSG